MIPKQFSVGSWNYTVKLATSKQIEEFIHKNGLGKDEGVGAKFRGSDVFGMCFKDYQVIFVNKETCRTQHTMEHTFWHEYVHALKYANGEVDHDEEEVDRLGALLQQFHLTKKGTH